MDKPNVRKSQVLEVCLSCGLIMDDGPHGTSDECIRALEAELHRLAALLQRVKLQKKLP